MTKKKVTIFLHG